VTFDRSLISFRDGERTDIEAVLSLWKRAFHMTDKRLMILRDLLETDPEFRVLHLRLLQYDKRLVGTVKTERCAIQFGRARLLCGDVGFVAIDPEFQGRGLGHLLMQDNCRVLEQLGCHLGRLGGYAEFYSRFGWSRHPSRCWRFPICDARLGAKTIPFEQTLSVEPEHGQCIRPMQKEKDWAGYASISRLCHRTTFWHQPADSPRRELDRRRRNDFELKRWVYDDKGRLRSYIFLCDDSHIIDGGWEPGHWDAFVPLIKTVLLDAHRSNPEARQVTGTLPWDSRLAKALAEAGVNCELAEIHGGMGSTMVRIVNLRRLVDNFLPELAGRVESYQPPPAPAITFKLTDSGEQVTIDLQHMRTFAQPCAKGIVCKTTQGGLISLICGSSCPKHAIIEFDRFPKDLRRFLNSLFPRQVVAGP